MIRDYLERYKNNVLQLGMMLKESKIYELECIESASLPAMTINGMPKSGTKQDISNVVDRYETLLKCKNQIIHALLDEVMHVQLLFISLQVQERYIIECKYWHRLGWDTIAAKMVEGKYKTRIDRMGVKRLHERVMEKLEMQERAILITAKGCANEKITSNERIG